MKRYKRLDYDIKLTMYLQPIIYETSAILGAVTYSNDDHKYHTDVNPYRVITGPLSQYGETLEPPIADEWESFVEDCKWLIKELGFTILSSSRSDDSKKSEYVIVYGLGDTPCGTLVYDLRISDHFLDAIFPKNVRSEVLEKLKMDHVLNGDATEAGIDFQIKHVVVGSVQSDSWDRAFIRLYNLLKRIRRQVQVRLKTRR